MGDERGNAIPANLSMNPINVAIGSQTLHASGVAWAFKLRKEDRAVLCYVGDGATSTGDFHEGMNFASTFKLPVVFCCINNGWAISTPTAKQTGAPTFAQKALAYGMPSMQVDGNDLFAMFKSTRDAINYARSGKGPWFIEAVTYRLGDHTTADDARRYRTADEVSAHCEMDPISRTRKYLESQNLWTPADQENLEKRATAIVHDVAHLALDMEPPTTADLFDHTFAELPDELLRQKRTLRTDCLGQQPELIEPSTEQDTPDHWRVMQ
jgi:pyruvate dehydrogenase E1 component alpha subunit